MAFLTPVSLDEAGRVAAACGLPAPDRVVAIAGGTVNSNFRLEAGASRWFLRVYEEQDHAGAEREAAVSGALAAAGLPVAAPVPTRLPGPLEVSGKPARVFAFLPGEMSCQRAVTASRGRAVGAAVGRAQAAAKEILGAMPESRFGPEALRTRLRLVSGRGRRDLAPAVDRARAALEALDGWDHGLPRGLIHGDLFRDNVLWGAPAGEEHDRISGLLDWESASLGPKIYDLAVVVLSWCWADRFSPDLARAVAHGYGSARAVEDDEAQAFRDALRFGAVRFLVTRLTDVELRRGQVAPGKDYRRFLTRLDDVEARDAAAWAGLLHPGA